SYNLVAGIDSGNHRHLVAARAFDFHELLADPFIALPALGVVHLGYDVYGITVGRVVDRGRRQRNNVSRLSKRNLDLDEHSWTKFAGGVRQRCLDLNITGGLVDNRVERRDPSTELGAGDIIAGDPESAA